MTSPLRLLYACLISSVVCSGAPAFAQGVPMAMNVAGELRTAAGALILNPAVNFRLEVWDRNLTCRLYAEDHVAEDLNVTQGRFSLVLGAGSSKQNYVAGTGSLSAAVFANPGAVAAFTGCPSGVTLASGDERHLRLSYDLGSGYATLTPDVAIVAAAYALVAETLGGYRAADFIKVADTGTGALNQANTEYAFSAMNWPRLKALLDGTSNQYLPTTPIAPIDFNGQRAINVANPINPTDAANKSYVDANIGGRPLDVSAVGPMVGNGSTLLWDATANRWVAGSVNTSPTGTAGGELTGTYPNPQIANNVITSAKIKSTSIAVNRLIITDATTGANLDYAECTVLGHVFSWTATGWMCTSVSSLAPVTSVAGKTGAVLLNVLDVGGLGTAATRDHGTAAGQVPLLDASARFAAIDGSQLKFINAVQLQSRDIASTTPLLGQVLGWNGSAWTPVPAGVGTVTSVTAANGLTGGVITSAGTIAVDTGTSANQILQLNASAQIPAVDGSQVFNVNAVKLQSRAVASTTPSPGQVLGWNGVTSVWEPILAASGSVINIASGVGLNGGPISTTGTLSVDVGSAAGKIVQENATAQIAQVNGSLTNPAYSFAGDLNTGVYSPSADQLALVTNGQAGLTLTADGLIGIGTAAPQAAFDVATIGTSSAILIPRDTTGNRPAGVNGMLRYNNSLNVMEGYINGAWSALSSGSSAGTVTNVAGGTGILGGPITTFGTLSVDVGSAANKIVRENASAQIAQTLGSVGVPTYTFAGDENTGFYSPGADQLTLVANGTAVLNATAAGYVGIGTTTPAARFSVRDSSAALTGTLTGAQFNYTSSPGGTGSGIYSATTATTTSTGTAGNIRGATTEVTTTVGSAVSATGSYNGVRNVGGSMGVARGVFNEVSNTNSLGITSAIGTLNNVFNSGSGTIGSAYGEYISAPTNLGGGAITNFYGVYVETPTAAGTNYAMYSQGGNNYFGGRTGVGVLSPQTALDVNGTGANSAILIPRDTTGNRPAGVNGMLRYNSSLNVMEGYINGNWSALSSGSSAGTVTNVAGGLGILGGPITTNGTLSVDVGSAANKIVQENGNAQIAQTIGSATTPAYSFAGDLNTGLYAIGADEMALATNGTARLYIGPSGGIGIGTTSLSGILHASTTGYAQQILESTQGGSGTLFEQNSFGAGGQSVHMLNATRGIKASPAALQAGDLIGYYGFGSSGYGQSARIYGTATGAFTGSSTPGDLEFQTTPVGSTSPVSRLTIDSAGRIGAGTTTPQSGFDLALTGTSFSSLILPRDTTANRPSGINGMLRYNNSLNVMEGYINGNWSALSSGSSAGTVTNVAGGVGILGGPITTNGTLSVDVGSAANKIVQENTNAQIAQLLGSASLPSYTFSGNTNTGWYSPATNQVSLVTNGTAALNVLANGNVGLGTASPAAKLHVLDSIRLSSNTTWPTLTLDSGNTNTNAATFIFRGGRSNNTAFPQSGDWLGEFSFRNNDDDVSAKIYAVSTENQTNSASGAAIGFQTTLNGGNVSTERMRIDYDGYVGIGSTSPQAALDVNVTGSGSAVIVPRDTTANRPAGINGMLRYNNSLNVMEGYINGAWSALSSGSSAGTVTNVAGGVGILGGPITTNGTLSVDVGTTANKIVQLNANAQLAPSFGTAALPSYSFTGNTNTGLFSPGANQLALAANGTAAVSVLASGFVGIGTTTPSNKLSVSGVADFSSTFGNVPGSAFGVQSSVSYGPTSTGTGIVLGNIGKVTVTGATADITGAGHTVGSLGWSVMNSAGRTANLVIGTEGKIDVTAGTVTNAVSAENQLASNAGTVVNWFGSNSHIVSNAGPISLAGGSNLQIDGNSATITTAAAASVSNPTNNTGTITNLVGLYFPSITSSGISTKYVILNQDSNALLYQGGASSLLGAVAVGSTTGAAMLDVRGTGSTSSTFTFGSRNSAGAYSLVVRDDGNVGIGTTGPLAALDITSVGTASAILIPRDTTANRPNGVNGMLRYNNSLNVMEGYINGSWSALASGSAAGTVTNVAGGTGILGGPITTNGTLSVDVGSAANKIVRENASAQIAQTLGSTTLPAYAFAGDENTGLYSPAADQLALAANGTTVVNISTAGVGIGTASPIGQLDVSGFNTTTVRSVVNQYGTGGVMLQLNAYGGGLPGVQMNQMRPGNGPTQNGDITGGITGRGYNGSTLVGDAQIVFTADQNFTGTSAPSSIRFYTTPTNALVPLQRLRIDPYGNLGIGTDVPLAALDVFATGSTSAMLVPRDTTANRPIGVNGMLRYNNSLNVMEGYINGSWSALSSGSSAGTVTNVAGGTGILGGPITTNGTLSVDVGSAANKIVQENTNAQIAQTLGTSALPSYSFAGNTNTGLYSPGTNQLALTTNGTSAFNVTAAGLIGIGTTNPSNLLDVQGAGAADVVMSVTNRGGAGGAMLQANTYGSWSPSVQLSAARGTVGSPSATVNGDWLGIYRTQGFGTSTTVGGSLIITGAEANFTNSSAPSNLTFSTTPTGSISATERVRLTGAGNLGIGTSTPQGVLDLYSVGSSSAMVLPRDSTANRPTGVNGMLRYNNSLNVMEGYINGNWSALASGSAAGTVTNVAGGTGILGGPITTNGTLSVDVGSAANKIVRENADAQIAQTLGTAALPTYSFAGDPDTGMYSSAADEIAFSTGGTNRMKLQGGALGIGTATPAAGLHVNLGTLMVSNPAAFAGATSSLAFHYGGGNGGSNAIASILATTEPMGGGNLTFNTAESGTSPFSTRLYVAKFGNIGIGTTSPQAALDVFSAGTTSALIVPRDTTGNRPTGVNGMLRYNTTLNQMEGYVNGTWANVATGTAAAGLINFTESVNSATPNTVTPVVSLAPQNSSANVDVALMVKGLGSILASVPDNTATGGNKRGTNAVDLQQARTANTNVASGTYATISGGRSNTASGNTSTVAGGRQGTASGAYSYIGGGYTNTAPGDYAMVIGGMNNDATADRSLAGGFGLSAPSFNQITLGSYNATTGGETAASWVATDPLLVVGNGTASGAARSSALTILKNGNVGIGTGAPAYMLHLASPNYAQARLENTQGGAGSELDVTTYGGGASTVFVTGARGTKAAPTYLQSGDLIGYYGASPSQAGAQSGRMMFYASGNWAANNTPGSIGFQTTPAGSGVPVERMYINQNGLVGIGTSAPLAALDVVSIGTVSAMIVPRDTTANRPTGVNGMLRYNNSLNAMEGYVNGAWSSFSTGTSGAGLTNFTESLASTSPNDTIPVAALKANNAATDVDVALSPKGAGALLGSVPDSSATGGNKRGQGAVDWQLSRTAANQVASGTNSVIAGGDQNRTSNGYATVGGGTNNAATGYLSVVVGGQSNTASGTAASVIGGSSGTASGDYSLAGGTSSTASGAKSVALGNVVVAPSLAQATLGSFSLPTGTENATTWISTDPLLVVGNGTSAATKSNAFVLLKNGNLGIGVQSPTVKLEINGPASVAATYEGVDPSYTSSGTTFTIPDASTAIRRISLTGNATITLPAFTAPTGKVYSMTVFLKQDATGGRTVTFAGASSDTVKWDSNVAPSISATANKITIIQLIKPSDEAVWYGSLTWRED